MDLSYVLLWLVGLSTLTWMVRWFQIYRWRYRGWHLAGLVVLGVTALALALDPEQAGYWGAAVWAGLLFVPLMGQRVAFRLIAAQRYGSALRVMRLIGLLHPADGWPVQTRPSGFLENSSSWPN